MAKETTKEITKSITEEYAALQKVNTIEEAIKENLQEMVDPSEGMNIFPKITVPTGGGLAWDLSVINEELSGEKVIEGIIFHIQPTRARFVGKYGIEKLPQCYSTDGVNGHGDPGGKCLNCYYNKFETAEEGTGKGCKEKQMLYILSKVSFMPIVISVPTMSIKSLKDYMRTLSWSGIPRTGVTTKMTLSKMQNSLNTAYSQIVFSKGSILRPEDREKIVEYKNNLIPLLQESFNVEQVTAEENVNNNVESFPSQSDDVPQGYNDFDHLEHAEAI